MLHEWTYFMDRWVKSPVQSPWEDSCVTPGLGGPPPMEGGGAAFPLFGTSYRFYAPKKHTGALTI